MLRSFKSEINNRFLSFYGSFGAEVVRICLILLKKKMSMEGKSVKALLSATLAAAGEEILAKLEPKIAEYEERLRLSKEEEQRKQQLLDYLLREGAKIPGLNEKIPEIPKIKQDLERSIKQEKIAEIPKIKEDPERSIKQEPSL